MAKKPEKIKYAFRIEAELLAALDKMRAKSPDLPSRGKLIRQLIADAAVSAGVLPGDALTPIVPREVTEQTPGK